jgi:hypothetical protein
MLQSKTCDHITMPALLDTCEAPILLSDTRQRAGHHDNILVAASRRGYEVRPAVLPVGDYQMMSPSGIRGALSIDTKRGVQEVQQNTVVERDRVAREMTRATEQGSILVFVIELEPEEVAAPSLAPTLCDTCARAGTCRHAGWCDQYDVATDFADAEQALRDFRDFTRSHGSGVVKCSVEDTGDVILDLLTSGSSAAISYV